jgi:hypothetical protein
MASADTKSDGHDLAPSASASAAEVLVEIAGHARWSVGSSAPALAGLIAWVEAYGVAAESTIPIEDGDDDLLRTAARMVLAPLGGIDLAASTVPTVMRIMVHEAADSVLGELNRLGERCLVALGKKSPLLPPPRAENVTPTSPNSGFYGGGGTQKM